MASIEQTEVLPVVELFADSTRRQIIDFALDSDPDEWYRTGEITDHTDVSRESVRKALPPLVAYGILDVRDPEANIPHYRVAETPVVDLLHEWTGYPLLELFHFTGAQKLVTFFLARADPDESYSQNAIQQQSPVGYDAVANHVDTLVDAGLVDAVDGTRSTEYRLDPESDIYAYLRTLNETIYETYLDRAE